MDRPGDARGYRTTTRELELDRLEWLRAHARIALVDANVEPSQPVDSGMVQIPCWGPAGGPARFGLRDQTLLDERVRAGWEIGRGKSRSTAGGRTTTLPAIGGSPAIPMVVAAAGSIAVNAGMTAMPSIRTACLQQGRVASASATW